MNARVKAGVVLVAAILIVTAIGFWLSDSRPSPAPVPVSSPQVPVPRTAASPLPSMPTARSQSDEQAWLEFRERFGASLSRELAVDGSLSAIRGAPGKGSKAEGAFRPDDVSQVQTRAREILAATSEILGLNADLPLGEPLTRTGPVSAQVHFRETWKGIPLEPSGAVVVDLGSQGELLNLSTDYVRDVHVTGERKLSPSDAKKQAEAAIATVTLPTTGGRPIVWVTRGRAGEASQGRLAYDYDVGGRQVVVDSETGKILMSRDRRQY